MFYVRIIDLILEALVLGRLFWRVSFKKVLFSNIALLKLVLKFYVTGSTSDTNRPLNSVLSIGFLCKEIDLGSFLRDEIISTLAKTIYQ